MDIQNSNYDEINQVVQELDKSNLTPHQEISLSKWVIAFKNYKLTNSESLLNRFKQDQEYFQILQDLITNHISNHEEVAVN